MPPIPRSPRRLRFRLGLRALLVLVLAIGLPLGWVARRIHDQRRAVAAVVAAGGTVTYDYQRSMKLFPEPPEPRGPRWLRRLIGDELFQEVVFVHFPKPIKPEVLRSVGAFAALENLSIADTAGLGDGLRHLRGLGHLKSIYLIGAATTDAQLADLAAAAPGLERVGLSDSSVTDAGLRHLGGLARLEEVSIRPATRVTDAGLVELARFPRLRFLELPDAGGLTDPGRLGGRLAHLETLDLERTGIDDAGMASLRRMTRLRWLKLARANLSDAGLAHLAGLVAVTDLSLRRMPLSEASLRAVRDLDNLRSLTIDHAGLTDAALAGLEGMSRLTALDLADNPAVTDIGLDHIAGLSGLQILFLGKTGITDAGLAKLAGFRSLDLVDLGADRVTPGAIAALRLAHPRLRVVTGGSIGPPSIPK